MTRIITHNHKKISYTHAHTYDHTHTMGYHDNCSQPAMFSSSVHTAAHDRARHTWGTLTSPCHTHTYTHHTFLLRETPAGACRVWSYHGNSIYRCGIAESTVRDEYPCLCVASGVYLWLMFIFALIDIYPSPYYCNSLCILQPDSSEALCYDISPCSKHLSVR